MSIQGIITSCAYLWGQKQDFCSSGILNDSNGEFEYMIIADGHGSGEIVTKLKSSDFPWEEILIQTSKDILSKTLINYLIYFNVLQNSKFDGTTISIVKIYSHFVHLLWIGDSKIQVYKNNHLYYSTPIHTCANDNEVNNNKKKDGWELKLINNKTISKIKGQQIIIDEHQSTPLTRCIGHNRSLNEEFDEKRIYIGTNDTFSIIAASDGFWDVAGTKEDRRFITDNLTTARNLVKLAIKRWKQTWVFYPPLNENCKSKPYSSTFPATSYDDIAICLWHN